MNQPVKLSADLVLDARLIGQAVRRSIAGQIEYWANMGRALEPLLQGGVALGLGLGLGLAEGEVDGDGLGLAEGEALPEAAGLPDGPAEGDGVTDGADRSPTSMVRISRNPAVPIAVTVASSPSSSRTRSTRAAVTAGSVNLIVQTVPPV